MKKVLLLAAAVVAMVACTKKKLDETVISRQEICFEMPVIAPSVQTKAPISGTVLPETVDFKVYAIKHSGDFTAWSAGAAYFGETGASVTYDQRATGWHSATAYYWPDDAAQKLSFQAYAPADLAEASIDGTGVKIDDFSLVADVANHVDVLYSERVVNKIANDGVAGSGNYGVQIPFHHALAQVAISAKLEKELPQAADYVKINSITVGGIKLNGAFAQYLADTAVAGEIGTPTWTPSGDNGNYNSLVIGTDPIALSTTANTASFNPCLVIPQNLTDAAVITINYDKRIDGVATANVSKAVQINTQLFDGVAATAFESAKKYVFNLIFGTGEIYFDPQVVDWTDVSVTGPTIKVN